MSLWSGYDLSTAAAASFTRRNLADYLRSQVSLIGFCLCLLATGYGRFFHAVIHSVKKKSLCKRWGFEYMRYGCGIPQVRYVSSYSDLFEKCKNYSEYSDITV